MCLKRVYKRFLFIFQRLLHLCAWNLSSNSVFVEHLERAECASSERRPTIMLY